MTDRLLRVEGLHAGYGPVRVLHDVSMHVDEGEIVAVLGANGAGKTTLMTTIMGLIRPSDGVVEFDGERVDRMATERIVRSGLTLVPEGRRVLGRLTVDENLRMGAFGRRTKRSPQDALVEYYERFPRLAERRGQAAGTLSGGEQQQLVICRALMGNPRVLLLDEPSLGLAPVMAELVFALLAELRTRDRLTIVVVEQSVSDALELADRAYVLDHGRIRASGTSEDVRTAAIELEQSYLGAEL